MAVLFVDLARIETSESTAVAAAEVWGGATGAVTSTITLSNGTTGFLSALALHTGAVARSTARRDDAGTVYAAASDLDGSAGMVELLASGPARLVLATGISTSEVPDGGASLLVELAVHGGLDRARALRAVTGDDGVEGAAALLSAARTVVAGIDLVGAVEGDAPLLGMNGVAATGEWPGGTAQAQQIEGRLGVFADLMYRAVQQGGPTRLMAVPRVASLPGAGSGGGLGHAIALLGGRLRPAIDVVAEAIGLGDLVAAADLVVVVTPELGLAEMSSGLIPVVGPLSAEVAVPLIVVAGYGLTGRREWSSAGISAVYEVDATSLRRVARTWSGTEPAEAGDHRS